MLADVALRALGEPARLVARRVVGDLLEERAQHLPDAGVPPKSARRGTRALEQRDDLASRDGEVLDAKGGLLREYGGDTCLEALVRAVAFRQPGARDVGVAQRELTLADAQARCGARTGAASCRARPGPPRTCAGARGARPCRPSRSAAAAVRASAGPGPRRRARAGRTCCRVRPRAAPRCAAFRHRAAAPQDAGSDRRPARRRGSRGRAGRRRTRATRSGRRRRPRAARATDGAGRPSRAGSRARRTVPPHREACRPRPRRVPRIRSRPARPHAASPPRSRASVRTRSGPRTAPRAACAAGPRETPPGARCRSGRRECRPTPPNGSTIASSEMRRAIMFMRKSRRPRSSSSETPAPLSTSNSVCRRPVERSRRGRATSASPAACRNFSTANDAPTTSTRPTARSASSSPSSGSPVTT